MNCNDSVVLIHAHLSNDERKDFCVNLIKKIKSFGYEIIITTHYPLDKDVQKLVDYAIYDKDNFIFNDYDLLGYLYLNTSRFSVQSKDFCSYNTYPAVHRLLKSGANYAKMLNKKIIHIMDYDVSIDNDFLLKENENTILKKNKKGVLYQRWWMEGMPNDARPLQITTNIMSVDVNSFHEIFKISEIEIAEMMRTTKFKMGEEIIGRLFDLEHYKHSTDYVLLDLEKDETILKSNFLKGQFGQAEDMPWICLIDKCRTSTENHHIFSYQPSGENSKNIKVIIDEMTKNQTLNKGNWCFFEIPVNAKNVSVYENDVLFKQYDLTNEYMMRKNIEITNFQHTTPDTNMNDGYGAIL